jgi:hypothetical protein
MIAIRGIWRSLWLLLAVSSCLPLAAQPHRQLLVREWKLDDLSPGFDLAELDPQDRTEALMLLEQLRQHARFHFRADSTYRFTMDKEESGTWEYKAQDSTLLTYRMGVDEPDTFRILKLGPDSLHMVMDDRVRNAEYSYKLVPAFALPGGMARFIVGAWGLGRVEYDTRQVPDLRHRDLLRQQMDSLRLGSYFHFTPEGRFRIRLLGSESAGHYSISNQNYLTLVEDETQARTGFIISAASPDAVLLVSNDPQRVPPNLQLVLVPMQNPDVYRHNPQQPVQQQGAPWRKP